MQTERMEWLQFQTDLQVAVAVAETGRERERAPFEFIRSQTGA